MKPEAIDTHYFEKFTKDGLGSFESYWYLGGDLREREKQKNLFLDDAIRNPTLDYPYLDDFDFDGKKERLRNLQGEIQAEGNDILIKAYLPKIEVKLNEISMLAAAKFGNDIAFTDFATRVFGHPQKDVHQYIINRLRKQCEEILTSEQPSDVRKVAAQALLEEIGVYGETAVEDYRSHDPNYADKEKDLEIVDCEVIACSFEQALMEFPGGESWRVDVSKNSVILSVSQEDKSIIIPQSRTMSRIKLRSLIAHEVGTHIVRRERGERSPLKLLGIGLDHHIGGEEGIATYNEMQISGAHDYPRLDRHFAAGLCAGFDGEKRDFRETYKLLKNYYLVKGESDVEATNIAWFVCVRTFRGTTCQTPGAYYPKDATAYTPGNIFITKMIRENHAECKRLMVGKYDPRNERHLEILDALGL